MEIKFSEVYSKYNDHACDNGLYKIVNTINSHWYVGSTNDGFAKRFRTHRFLLRKNKHSNKHLQNAYNKYGEEAFVFIVIEVASDNLLEKEQDIIDEHYGQLYFYNISQDSSAPMAGRKHSSKSIEKISKASKKNGKKIGELTRKRQLGTKHHKETIEKMKKSAKSRDDSKRMEKLKSEEFRKNMSEIKKGKPLSDEHRKNLTKALQTPEYRQKMSDIKSGVPKSKSMKSKASKARLGMSVTLEKNEIKEEILSLRNFAEKHGLNRKELSKLIKGKREDYNGWTILSIEKIIVQN